MRQRRPPAHLNDSVITETTGSRNHVLMKDDYCTQYYYPILDRVLAEMQSRFSNLSLSLMNSVQACLSKSSNFLDAMSLQPLIEHYNIENTSLPVELLQAKRVLITKEVTTIAGAIQELLPLRVALCSPLFSGVYLRLPRFSRACLPMFTRSLVFTYVYTCLPMFAPVYLFTYVYLCLPIVTPVYSCLPMFSRICL